MRRKGEITAARQHRAHRFVVSVTVPLGQTLVLLDCERLSWFLGAEPARGPGYRGNDVETGTFCFSEGQVADEFALRVRAAGLDVTVLDTLSRPAQGASR